MSKACLITDIKKNKGIILLIKCSYPEWAKGERKIPKKKSIFLGRKRKIERLSILKTCKKIIIEQIINGKINVEKETFLFSKLADNTYFDVYFSNIGHLFS